MPSSDQGRMGGMLCIGIIGCICTLWRGCSDCGDVPPLDHGRMGCMICMGIIGGCIGCIGCMGCVACMPGMYCRECCVGEEYAPAGGSGTMSGACCARSDSTGLPSSTSVSL